MAMHMIMKAVLPVSIEGGDVWSMVPRRCRNAVQMCQQPNNAFFAPYFRLETATAARSRRVVTSHAPEFCRSIYRVSVPVHYYFFKVPHKKNPPKKECFPSREFFCEAPAKRYGAKNKALPKEIGHGHTRWMGIIHALVIYDEIRVTTREAHRCEVVVARKRR